MKAGRSALLERTSAEASRGRFTPTAGMAKLLGVLVVPIAVIATGVGVVATSYSSFQAVTTPNTGSNWATGSVVLSNDVPLQSALFNATGLKPGATSTQCIKVTSTGTLPATVHLYTTGSSSTKDLSSWINISIVQGSGTSGFGTCNQFTPLTSNSAVFSGTLSALGTTNSNYGNGIVVWSTTGGATATESRTFQITYTVSADIPNTSQLGTAAANFTWEAQNS